MSYKLLSNPFYSNCLIEAIKFKIQNWKNIKICKIPPYLTRKRTPHFYCKDIKSAHIYSFLSTKKKNALCTLFFKGQLIEMDKKEHEKLINHLLRTFIWEEEKELEFKSEYSGLEKIIREGGWKDYFKTLKVECFRKGNPYNFIEGSYKGENGEDIIKYYEIGDKGIINPSNDNILFWRVPIYGKPL